MEIPPMELRQIQHIPRAPNRTASSIDWMPDFAGYGWLAYGAGHSVVITTTPSPVSPQHETKIGSFFQQILQSSDDVSDVVALSWCPSHDGALAVAFDHDILIYEPQFPELPLNWRQKSLLPNCFAVHVVSWTQSGNGLIAAGSEVVMWAKMSDGWCTVWKSRPDEAHFLASATWTVKGFTATAPGVFRNLSPLTSNSSKGKVSVWHWNEKSGLQETKLSHPQPVSFVQWRPLKFPSLQRQALLTCSVDGAARLWIEVESGRAGLDETFARDFSDNARYHFFVAAVIEVDQCLGGSLGQSTLVMWARDIVKDISENAKAVCTDAVGRKTSGDCEWLLAMGPNNSLAWWSLHCLDDLSPLRSPRVFLWRKAVSLPINESSQQKSENFPALQHSSLFLKAFVHRVAGRLSSPPSSADIFQLLPENIFSWSRVWPPMASFGIDTQVEENIYQESETLTSQWGIETSTLVKNSHSERIIDVGHHPIPEMELIASVDYNGLVLVWSSRSYLESQIKSQTLLHPVWQVSGRIFYCSPESKYSFITWAPVVLKEHTFLLFIGHSQGFDCVFVKENCIDNVKTFQHKVAYSVLLPDSLREKKLEHLHAILITSIPSKEDFRHTIMVIGSVEGGGLASFWIIQLHAPEENSLSLDSIDICTKDTGDLDISKNIQEQVHGKNNGYTLSVEECIPNFANTNANKFTFISAFALRNLLTTCKQSTFSVYSSEDKSPYDFATSHSDGIVKLWKIDRGENWSSSLDHEKNNYLNCVGIIKVGEAPVEAISLSGCGAKIATVYIDDVSKESVLSIWGAESSMSSGSFMLEDKIHFSNCIIGLDWFVLGGAYTLLAVAMVKEVRVYCQRRCPIEAHAILGETKDTHLWSYIATYRSTFDIKKAIWTSQGRLLLVYQEYISVLSSWGSCSHKTKYRLEKISDDNSINSVYIEDKKFKLNTTKMDYESSVLKSTILPAGLQNPEGCLDSMSSSKLDVCCYSPKLHYCSLFQIADKLGGALPVYHPSAILHYLLRGNIRRAVACIRHLMVHLDTVISMMKKTDSNIREHFLSIPAMHLSELLGLSEEKDRGGIKWETGIDMKTSFYSKQDPIMEYQNNNDINARNCKDTLGKSEVDDFMKTFVQWPSVPGLLDSERAQLLALLDVLGEISSRCGDFDEAAQRFWILLRVKQAQFQQITGRKPSAGEITVESRAITWAYHSECQDNLLDSCLSENSTWHELRSLGVGFWFRNNDSMRKRVEKLARMQYIKQKDPKDCALLYMALDRKSVLMGLFKASRDEKDKSIAGFLARNFKEEKHKEAALKNAYVLKGKHQFGLSAAFFLLGGDPSSAVSICARDMKDGQLALVICRLIEVSNGMLAKDIIEKQILPAAEETKDRWLVCLLQWQLGKSVEALKKLIQPSLPISIPEQRLMKESPLEMLDVIQHANLDFDTWHFCRVLAAKTSIRAAIGERNVSAVISWATVKASTTLKRYGLPFEALEYLSAFSSSSSNDRLNLNSTKVGGKGTNKDVPLCSSIAMEGSWISETIVTKLAYEVKLNLVMQYLIKFVSEYPCRSFVGFLLNVENDSFTEHGRIMPLSESSKSSDKKLARMLQILQQSCSIHTLDALYWISNHAYHSVYPSLWPHLLHDFIQECEEADLPNIRLFGIFPSANELFQKATEETFYFLNRIILACGFNTEFVHEKLLISNSGYSILNLPELCFGDLFCFYTEMEALGEFLFSKLSQSEQQNFRLFMDTLCLTLCILCLWLHRDAKSLITIVQSVGLCNTADSLPLLDARKWVKHVLMSGGLNHHNSNKFVMDAVHGDDSGQTEQSNIAQMQMSGDDMWQFVGVCLWGKLSCFIKNILATCPTLMNFDMENRKSGKSDLNLSLIKEMFLSSLNCISDGLNMQLAWIVKKLYDTQPQHPTLCWLECLQFPEKENADRLEKTSNYDSHQVLNATKIIGSDSLRDLFQVLAKDEAGISFLVSKGYKDFSSKNNREKATFQCDRNDPSTVLISDSKKLNDQKISLPNITQAQNHRAKLSVNGMDLFDANHAIQFQGEGGLYFHNPKEVVHSNGELFEAMCINSCNQEQAVVASNRKGLFYFNLNMMDPLSKPLNHLWSEAEWPKDGWAGCRSTPMPTFVSAGVGLGSKEGSRLGLGGATVGLGTFPRTGKDRGLPFGIPGYAGIGAMGLGWGEWEDFEGLVDPPATIDNISTRAMDSHPLRPLFLVGSSNTHVYLWEFGKATATATYGVLPAANVPPPYALASVSTVKFDYYGHRFVTAALDGTVCTWQLEVGGRNNVRPIGSSLCFHQHASDAAFVGASGSIIAATGSSSNSVNLSVRDTLAPPSSACVSIKCHEGGARSLAVFDHDVGSMGISSLIITGGKSGDVGVHDVRYFGRGNIKHQKYSKYENLSPSNSTKDSPRKEDFSTADMTGEQNYRGMLWHIPKAHEGSVTRISVIPGSNLFLTGSKDGDIKLWDAKAFKLVHHWVKVHDRHTFLQPNSRRLGGVVQAAVTDIRVSQYGFLTCGGDGTVKLFEQGK